MRFPEFSEEWERITLYDVIKIQGGYAFKSEEFQKNGVPIIRISNLPQNTSTVNLKDCVYYDDCKLSNFEISNGDLLIAMSGATTGKTAVYRDNRIAYLNQRVGCFKIKDESKLFYPYLYALVDTKVFRGQLVTKLIAGAQPNISPSDIETIKISVPILGEQRKIANLMSLLDDRIATQIKIIEDLKKLKSAIRAKVFKQLESSCECWSEIGNMLQYEQPSKYLVTSTEYSDSYTTPVLTANKAFILGYTDEEFGIYSKGECVIFDDFTMDVKYVNFPFKVKSSAIKILTANSGNDLYFVYEYLQNLGLVSEEHKRHYISEIEPMVVACPTFEEQQNISNLLRSFDSKIECANRKLILYNKQKQHLLSQMFI